MGGSKGRCVVLRVARARLLRALIVAASAATLSLVALPTGASAAPRVPPPGCPPEVTLQGIERAPGGVILTGAVVLVTQEVGRVRIAVDAWYHRGMIPGLASGEHPAIVDVALGPNLSAAGLVAPTAMPQVGSRFIVAGTWTRPHAGVSVACGVLANVNTPAGEDWLERAVTTYAAVAPTSGHEPPPIPLDAPWFVLIATAAALVVMASILAAFAQARDPLPAV